MEILRACCDQHRLEAEPIFGLGIPLCSWPKGAFEFEFKFDVEVKVEVELSIAQCAVRSRSSRNVLYLAHI